MWHNIFYVKIGYLLLFITPQFILKTMVLEPCSVYLVMYSANNKIFYKSLKTGKIKETILSFSASDWVVKTAVVICLGYSFIPVLGEQASILI